MARPLTRAQALENQAFLAELRRTGNARESARRLGEHRAKFTRRRARDAAFAAEWDAALAIAQAALAGRAGIVPACAQADAASAEPRLVRLASGKLQLRRAQQGRLTRADEQAFLSALAATANVRLSARAAGFSHAAFYHRRRTSPGFAREMRMALEQGYERLEDALLAAAAPAAHRDDAWRHNEPREMPPLTANQAIHLLHLHDKQVRGLALRPDLARRRGESGAAWSARLEARWHEERLRREEADDVIAANREAPGMPAAHEPPPPHVPDLAQVTGWSRAAKGEAYHADRPLFGGWRLGDRIPSR